MNGISPCPDECPGCEHRSLTEAQSLELKYQRVCKNLEPWHQVIEPVEAPEPNLRTGYRDKVRLSACFESGRWKFGLVSGDSVVPIHACPVHTARVNQAVKHFTSALPSPDDMPLLYYTQSGAQVCLVVKSRHMPKAARLEPSLIEKVKKAGIEGIWLHCNPSAGRKVFAKNWWRLVWGSPRSKDDQGLVYGPTSFQQVMPGLFRKALDAAEDFFEPGDGCLFLDFYCGIGGSTARWSGLADLAAGVEINGESIDCAEKNAPAAYFYRGAGKHRLPQLNQLLRKRHSGRFVCLNPPRTGIEPEVCEWIVSACRPSSLACLSCSPGTLRRDLFFLEGNGFSVERIIPFDFFPRTGHVECLALLSRRAGG